MSRIILAIFVLLLITPVFSQVNFKQDFLQNDPDSLYINLSNAERIEIYEAYIDKAKSKNDTLDQLYGLFYLFAEHMRGKDLVSLKKIVLRAEDLVNKNSPPEWKGALAMRTAYLMEYADKDIPQAINEYKKGLEYCKLAMDSLCIGESLEQLSNLNKTLGNYDEAEMYFNKAIPILRKHANPSGLALTYNNYSLLLSNQGKFIQAHKFIDSAITIVNKNNDKYNQLVYLSNKALFYYQEEDYAKAAKIWEDIVPKNIENNWTDNLIYNYSGLAASYENLKLFEKSSIYIQNYYELKDSLEGAKVKETINKLEITDQLKTNTLLLKEKELELISSKLSRDRLVALLTLLFLAFCIFLIIWFNKTKNAAKEKSNNLKYIQDLKKILITKNEQISSLAAENDIIQKEKGNIQESESTTDDINDYQIFDARIINDEGITAFKTYFDKIYPGLLISIRKRWPTMSDAEERLFMLIKLKIKSKEAATILGISQASVKKSRNRLRKRLQLEPTINLEVFINSIK